MASVSEGWKDSGEGLTHREAHPRVGVETSSLGGVFKY